MNAKLHSNSVQQNAYFCYDRAFWLFRQRFGFISVKDFADDLCNPRRKCVKMRDSAARTLFVSIVQICCHTLPHYYCSTVTSVDLTSAVGVTAFMATVSHRWSGHTLRSWDHWPRNWRGCCVKTIPLKGRLDLRLASQGGLTLSWYSSHSCNWCCCIRSCICKWRTCVYAYDAVML